MRHSVNAHAPPAQAVLCPFYHPSRPACRRATPRQIERPCRDGAGERCAPSTPDLPHRPGAAIPGIEASTPIDSLCPHTYNPMSWRPVSLRSLAASRPSPSRRQPTTPHVAGRWGPPWPCSNAVSLRAPTQPVPAWSAVVRSPNRKLNARSGTSITHDAMRDPRRTPLRTNHGRPRFTRA